VSRVTGEAGAGEVQLRRTPGPVPLGQAPAPERTRADWVRWAAVGCAAALELGIAKYLGPRVAIAPLAAYEIGFGAVVASALACALICPPVQKRDLWLALLPAAVLCGVALAQPPEFGAAIVVTIALLLGGTLIGGAVGFAIEHPGHLIFVAIVSAAADAASVFHPSGPSAAIVQSKHALSLLALPWPMLGTHQLEPFLGVGDVIFTSLYIASTRRHALPIWRSALGLTLGYVVTMVTVVALEATVPALPFLGLGIVLAQPAARRPPLPDRARGYTLAALVVGIVAALLLLT
jgi:hypothetical protein